MIPGERRDWPIFGEVSPEGHNGQLLTTRARHLEEFQPCSTWF